MIVLIFISLPHYLQAGSKNSSENDEGEETTTVREINMTFGF